MYSDLELPDHLSPNAKDLLRNVRLPGPISDYY